MASGPIHVTLSDEAAVEFVRGKVKSGEYASEADVVREGISAMQEEEAEVERWLREVAGPRYDSFHADPSSGIPIDQVEKNLEERRRRRAESGS
jgi:putative addiction module CopG family antidote